MPGGDRTGPAGQGPMTGRAAGYCAGYNVPGYMNPVPGRGFRGAGRGGYPRGGGRGRVWGGGRGYGRAYYPPQPPVHPGYAQPVSAEEEMRYLENQASALKEELKQIENRLEEIKSETSNSKN